MATRIFQWGTVRSTPNGVSLVFGSPNRLDLSFRDAESVEIYLAGRFTSPLMLLTLRLEWTPPAHGRRAGPRFVFNIGRRNSKYNWITTPTLLSFDEAMELGDAIRSVTRSVQTAAAAP